MKQPFYWHHNLLYEEKSREAYTMEKEGTLEMDNLNVTPAVLYLVRWMAWAILKMQKTKPAGLDVFLEKYQQDISRKRGGIV